MINVERIEEILIQHPNTRNDNFQLFGEYLRTEEPDVFDRNSLTSVFFSFSNYEELYEQVKAAKEELQKNKPEYAPFERFKKKEADELQFDDLIKTKSGYKIF